VWTETFIYLYLLCDNAQLCIFIGEVSKDCNLVTQIIFSEKYRSWISLLCSLVGPSSFLSTLLLLSNVKKNYLCHSWFSCYLSLIVLGTSVTGTKWSWTFVWGTDRTWLLEDTQYSPQPSEEFRNSSRAVLFRGTDDTWP